jgi:hypothetical protein
MHFHEFALVGAPTKRSEAALHARLLRGMVHNLPARGGMWAAFSAEQDR